METLLDFLQRNWFFFAIIAGLLYALWRQPRDVKYFASRRDFELLINAGFPVIVEFFEKP